MLYCPKKWGKYSLIILDAPTINSLDDSYLISSIEDGAEPFEYVFEFEDIELSSRRDTDKEAMKALDNLASRMIELEGNYEEQQEKQKEKWIEEFIQSKYFVDLSEYQKENASFIIGTFMDFMNNYEYVQPEEWNSSNITEVCLNIVPRKITSELELFENYGDVLMQFFSFLGYEKYLKSSEQIVQAVDKIKASIPVEANNPNNWGMAKSMMMSAQKKGVDFTDETELQNYLMNQNIEYLSRENEGKVIPLKQDPYKNIGRNQKVTVKYSSGKIMENIKFKKVELDLRNGLCEIISE